MHTSSNNQVEKPSSMVVVAPLLNSIECCPLIWYCRWPPDYAAGRAWNITAVGLWFEVEPVPCGVGNKRHLDLSRGSQFSVTPLCMVGLEANPWWYTTWVHLGIQVVTTRGDECTPFDADRRMDHGRSPRWYEHRHIRIEILTRITRIHVIE